MGIERFVTSSAVGHNVHVRNSDGCRQGNGSTRLSGENRPRLCGGCPADATWPRDGHKELQNRPPKSHGRTIFVPAAPSSPRGLKTKKIRCVSQQQPPKEQNPPRERQKSLQNRLKRSHHPLFFVWFLSATSKKQPTPPHHQLTQGGSCPPLDYLHYLLTSHNWRRRPSAGRGPPQPRSDGGRWPTLPCVG